MGAGGGKGVTGGGAGGLLVPSCSDACSHRTK